MTDGQAVTDPAILRRMSAYDRLPPELRELLQECANMDFVIEVLAMVQIGWSVETIARQIKSVIPEKIVRKRRGRC